MEWNVLYSSESQQANNSIQVTGDILKEFDRLLDSDNAKDYSIDFLDQYREYLRHHPKLAAQGKSKFNFNDHKPLMSDEIVRPNSMQEMAIIKLNKLRELGQTRALAIAATSSGKTYMSVFDALQYKPKRLLFIVHRAEILTKAKESFDNIIGKSNIDSYSSAFFNAKEKNTQAQYIFASRDTLKDHYQEFAPDTFDYIVIDEAHHATSEVYQRIINYFKPNFLLGLTATPERSDAGDVFELFDNNIAVEIRLREALAFNLICPFHYFGITDASVDFDIVNKPYGEKRYIEEIVKLLNVGQRVDFIIEKMKFYDHDGDGKAKVLGFCASTDHAQYMADEFNKRLAPDKNDYAVALSGNDAPQKREEYIKKLEDENDPLNVIFPKVLRSLYIQKTTDL